MATIHKKVWREYFEQIISGKKKFELRLADFEIKEGDILILEEWDKDKKEYTGRKIEVIATYIFKTKGQTFWPPEEVEKYGFQIIQFETKIPMESQKMSGSKLLAHAKQLQQKAKLILDQLGIIEILKEVSEPKIIGSAANGLMVLKDIDIHAYVKEYDMERILNLLPKLALLPTVRKVQFNNYREFRQDYRKDRVGFPHGYYIGLRSVQDSDEWKIDIWFIKEDEDKSFNNSRLKNISDKQREIILKLKNSWLTKDGYRNGVLSVDFYKAVLDFGVETEKDFEHYLETKELK
jgi:hypothetical protein